MSNPLQDPLQFRAPRLQAGGARPNPLRGGGSARVRSNLDQIAKALGPFGNNLQALLEEQAVSQDIEDIETGQEILNSLDSEQQKLLADAKGIAKLTREGVIPDNLSPTTILTLNFTSGQNQAAARLGPALAEGIRSDEILFGGPEAIDDFIARTTQEVRQDISNNPDFLDGYAHREARMVAEARGELISAQIEAIKGRKLEEVSTSLSSTLVDLSEEALDPKTIKALQDNIITTFEMSGVQKPSAAIIAGVAAEVDIMLAEGRVDEAQALFERVENLRLPNDPKVGDMPEARTLEAKIFQAQNNQQVQYLETQKRNASLAASVIQSLPSGVIDDATEETAIQNVLTNANIIDPIQEAKIREHVQKHLFETNRGRRLASDEYLRFRNLLLQDTEIHTAITEDILKSRASAEQRAALFDLRDRVGAGLQTRELEGRNLRETASSLLEQLDDTDLNKQILNTQFDDFQNQVEDEVLRQSKSRGKLSRNAIANITADILPSFLEKKAPEIMERRRNLRAKEVDLSRAMSIEFTKSFTKTEAPELPEYMKILQKGGVVERDSAPLPHVVKTTTRGLTVKELREGVLEDGTSLDRIQIPLTTENGRVPYRLKMPLSEFSSQVEKDPDTVGKYRFKPGTPLDALILALPQIDDVDRFIRDQQELLIEETDE